MSRAKKKSWAATSIIRDEDEKIFGLIGVKCKNLQQVDEQG
jgi:hypothetical protein